MENKNYIIRQFRRIKRLGFIESTRSNNTGIGKTFEDYAGVTENNLRTSDLAGFEIKAHRELSSSFITLFTKSPSFPARANSYLRDRFGIPYAENPDIKRLHTSMFADRWNSLMGKYAFRLTNDPRNGLLHILVRNAARRIIDDTCGYTYEDIDFALSHKLKNLFLVHAETRVINGKEYFWFNHAEIYSNPTMERFLDLLDAGNIMYDIRIGSYQSGARYGMPHDHGSGFRIQEYLLSELYEYQELVE